MPIELHQNEYLIKVINKIINAKLKFVNLFFIILYFL